MQLFTDQHPILIVEDDVDHSSLVCSILERAEFEVLLTINAGGGFVVARQNDHSLLLLCLIWICHLSWIGGICTTSCVLT